MTQRMIVLRTIHAAAKRRGLSFAILREGGSHTVFSLDGLRLTIPRHREIDEKLTRAIYAQAGKKLGKDWWR